jgi:hypothetical protein
MVSCNDMCGQSEICHGQPECFSWVLKCGGGYGIIGYHLLNCGKKQEKEGNGYDFEEQILAHPDA